jgi:phage gpG-like protein
MIEVKIDSKVVIDALDRLAKAAANPRPALLAIGESLVVSTKKRFESSTAPDGTRWTPNSPVTYSLMVNGFGKHRQGFSKSNFGKSGRVNAKGGARLAGKKPLIGQTGSLSGNITYEADGNGLRVGSTMEYAAMQQFGGKKSQFPNLLGDIPARPFLGVSDADEKMILGTVSEYLSNVV